MKYIRYSIFLFLLGLAGCAKTIEVPLDSSKEYELNRTAAFEDAPDNIINGGFESGDLRGWETEGLAFTVFGVTDEETYWGGPFNQIGDYHFYGHYSAPGRMTGQMKSNVFHVSATGTFSFLIGAGRDHDLMHVSLVNAATDEVVARFVNTQFVDPDHANDYLNITFSLEDYVGEYLYVNITDEDASNDGFSYINVDDFKVVYDD